MVRVKNEKRIELNLVEGCLRAYLEGKKNLNWLMAEINKTGIRGSDLWGIFYQWRGYGDPDRHRIAKEACEEAGWMKDRT